MVIKLKNNTGLLCLQQRDWCSLTLLAERWSCSIEDVLYLGQAEKLRISHNLARVKGLFRYYDENLIPPFQEYEATQSGIFGIAGGDVAKLANGSTSFSPKLLFSPGPVISKQGRFSSIVVIESDPISLQGMIVISEELSRFESENIVQIEQEKVIEKDWKRRASEIRDTCDVMNQEAMAQFIADKLKKEKVYGRGERAISASTIQREVLRRFTKAPKPNK